MKAAMVKLLFALAMVGTMAGCASTPEVNPGHFDSLAHPEAYSPN